MCPMPPQVPRDGRRAPSAPPPEMYSTQIRHPVAPTFNPPERPPCPVAPPPTYNPHERPLKRKMDVNDNESNIQPTQREFQPSHMQYTQQVTTNPFGINYVEAANNKLAKAWDEFVDQTAHFDKNKNPHMNESIPSNFDFASMAK